MLVSLSQPAPIPFQKYNVRPTTIKKKLKHNPLTNLIKTAATKTGIFEKENSVVKMPPFYHKMNKLQILIDLYNETLNENLSFNKTAKILGEEIRYGIKVITFNTCLNKISNDFESLFLEKRDLYVVGLQQVPNITNLNENILESIKKNHGSDIFSLVFSCVSDKTALLVFASERMEHEISNVEMRKIGKNVALRMSVGDSTLCLVTSEFDSQGAIGVENVLRNIKFPKTLWDLKKDKIFESEFYKFDYNNLNC
ncbi:hypothetical protein MHBO_003076 [Bonamia ostreae]|uniref:Ribosomal protein S2 n=1 Tax=Bonamia ostreae TaxID=126728 RepID=A0ABV2AQ59_9EUKA